jgi:hypothetical protein
LGRKKPEKIISFFFEKHQKNFGRKKNQLNFVVPNRKGLSRDEDRGREKQKKVL